MILNQFCTSEVFKKPKLHEPLFCLIREDFSKPRFAQNFCHHFTWFHRLRKFPNVFQPIIIQNYDMLFAPYATLFALVLRLTALLSANQNWDRFIMYIISIGICNHTMFPVRFGINLHEKVFQKAEIARAASASAISVFNFAIKHTHNVLFLGDLINDYSTSACWIWIDYNHL